ncbi:MAG: TerC family protein [Myxococcales bacterium]|nr:TerC family protein [Myxococcales bacterium]MCB9643397.1 TerC family protein [Myxococcales bacterium]
MWILFHVFLVLMLAMDLGVFHRKSHQINVREALIWSAIWISLAMLFNLGIYFWRGSEHALQFFTGYVLEKSLSVDNLFVFVLIFSFFKVPASYQHKVLAWGIIGALVMRATMIFAGVQLIQRFHWILYFFGAFLVFTGIKMAFEKETGVHPEENPVIKLVRRLFRVTEDYEDDQIFVRKDGVLWATPLLVVIAVIEATDVVFAVDSIPAVLAVSRDPFIVYTSNIFAILGLRSLYFALAGVIDRFHLLKYGLGAVLTFVGVKMLINDYYHIPTMASLLVVVGLLGASVVASLLIPPNEEEVVHLPPGSFPDQPDHETLSETEMRSPALPDRNKSS